MALVDKRLIRKVQTKNAICRLTKGSLQTLNREKLSQKLFARFRRDREALLDEKRDIKKDELKRMATDLVKETYNDDLGEFCIDREIGFEEEFEAEAVKLFEEWFQREIDEILSGIEDSEDSEPLLVCPVCCKKCYHVYDTHIRCQECKINLPNTKPIDVLRNDINGCLAEHNALCRHRPLFTHIPDSGGQHNSLFIVCHSCSYMNILL